MVHRLIHWRSAQIVLALTATTACLLAVARPTRAAPPGPDYSFQVIQKIVTPAPGMPGKYLVRDFEADALNNNGDMAWGADFSATATPVPPAEGEGVYITSGGTTTLIARTGGTDPYGEVYSPAGYLGMLENNDAGNMVMAWRLLPAPTGGTNATFHSGLYRYTKSTGLVTTITKSGWPAPAGSDSKFYGVNFGTVLNNIDVVQFHGIIKTTAGTYTNPADGQKYGVGIFRADASNNITALVLPGDAAPSGGLFNNLRNSWMNDRGDLAFGGHTTLDTTCTSLSCLEGTYVKWASGGPIVSIAHPGDVAPIAPIGDWKFEGCAWGPRINNRGDVVFNGCLKNYVTGVTGRGLFLYRNGTVQPLIYPGSTVPDGANNLAVINASFIVQNWFLNDAGDIAFNMQYNADVNADGIKDTGVFVWSNGTFWRVAKTGDNIPGVGAAVHFSNPASVYPTFSTSNPQSRALINAKGQVLFTVTLSDLSAYLILATPTSGYSCTTIAATVKCAAVADSRTSSGSPGSNFGSSTYLRTRGTTSPLHNSYLKFDVRGLNGTVQDAKLRLYAYDGGVNGGSVYSVPTTWTEPGITWSNQPPLSGSPLSSLGAVPTNSWAEYTVTSAITSGLLGFGLTTPSSDSLYLHSREAYANEKPELVITLNP